MKKIEKKTSGWIRVYKKGVIHCPNALEVGMLEKTIERYLIKQVQAAGGLALKWVSPGQNGVPDRIVFFPGGRILFVEVKAPGKKLRPLQIHFQKILESLGADFRVIDSKEAVNALFC